MSYRRAAPGQQVGFLEEVVFGKEGCGRTPGQLLEPLASKSPAFLSGDPTNI